MPQHVAILWDELLGAFTNMEADRVYFFDRATGEIFFVRADQGELLRQELDQRQDRFLEIPHFDHAAERQLLTGFNRTHDNEELRSLLHHALSGRPPYVTSHDILAFFPHEEQQLGELTERFLSNRVKDWLEEHNLLSISSSLRAVN